jgi:hypothetical protein
MTIERRAVDALLSRHPDFDVLVVDWSVGIPSPWLIVELGQRSEDGAEVWARHTFAIWKTTGAVHGLQRDGSVTDDPLFIA